MSMIPELTKKIINRIHMLISMATIDTVNDTTDLQTVKINGLSDEVQDKIERIQNFGFTSVPPKGAESVTASLSGNKDNTMVIACDSAEHRKKNLKEGESALYDKNGNYVYLREDGSVAISASGGVVITGDLDVTGDITATGNITSSLIDLNGFYTKYLTHIHATAPPGPVSPPTQP